MYLILLTISIYFHMHNSGKEVVYYEIGYHNWRFTNNNRFDGGNNK